MQSSQDAWTVCQVELFHILYFLYKVQVTYIQHAAGTSTLIDEMCFSEVHVI